MNGFKAFSSGSLSDYLLSRSEQLIREVSSEDENQFLNMNETAYIDYLVEKFSIEQIHLDFKKMSVTDEVRNVPARLYPNDYDVREGRHYKRQVVTFHIPFRGDKTLLRYLPTLRIGIPPLLKQEEDEITFRVINFDDQQRVQRGREENVRFLTTHLNSIQQDVEEFNESLKSVAIEAVQQRKSEILRRRHVLESLGVPIKKVNPREAFNVPITKKTIVIKPQAPSTAYQPEPALGENVYSQILGVIYDFGREMERHPGMYEGKDEEGLRDLLIALLCPHFQSVTGESFNKEGRTDILIRHEGANVFIAECKFWTGGKGLLKAINQILGYLTWRDSKAALVLFIKNVNLDPVLKVIPSNVADHSNFIDDRGSAAEGWYRFELHIKDDHTRSVHLTILCFHLP